ncbi:FlgD immunoglobulin-like domain containing protein [Methylogaea oryzae]|uniref:FlgD immunoglobulin-like domain containing protein n=1 Tax=Methylogaea oryzae TaxID=1295382 RepID=UPI0006D1746E|nr:FlgD immunoglobulin-like domain containing protein [Methylogaea oryzae]
MSFDISTAKQAGLATEAATAAKKKSGQLDQADFMKLLTTQLQHQDPLSPQDSSKLLEQMSMMGQIQGMKDMSSGIQTMVDAMSAGRVFQASSMIGRSVLVAGDNADLAAGGQVKGQVELPSTTENWKVTVTDSHGDVVRVMDMGAHDSGKANFTWDGRKDDGTQAAAGSYTFKAEAPSTASWKRRRCICKPRSPASISMARGHLICKMVVRLV